MDFSASRWFGGHVRRSGAEQWVDRIILAVIPRSSSATVERRGRYPTWPASNRGFPTEVGCRDRGRNRPRAAHGQQGGQILPVGVRSGISERCVDCDKSKAAPCSAARSQPRWWQQTVDRQRSRTHEPFRGFPQEASVETIPALMISSKRAAQGLAATGAVQPPKRKLRPPRTTLLVSLMSTNAGPNPTICGVNATSRVPRS